MTPRTQKIASATLIVSVFVFWEIFCVLAGISELILPRPSHIIEAFLQYAPAIAPHAWQTLYTTLVGFLFGVLIGLSLGVLIGSSKLCYDTAYPLLVGLSLIHI